MIVEMDKAERLMYTQRRNAIGGVERNFAYLCSNFWLAFPQDQAVLYQPENTFEEVKVQLDMKLLGVAFTYIAKLLHAVDPSCSLLKLGKGEFGAALGEGVYRILCNSKAGLYVLKLDNLELGQLITLVTTLHDLREQPIPLPCS